MNSNLDVSAGIEDSVLKNEIARRIKVLENKLLEIDKSTRDVPKGCVDVVSQGNNFYYRHVVSGEGVAKTEKKYLSAEVPEQKMVIEKLINKNYYKKLRPIVEAEFKALQAFYKNYKPDLKYQAFDKMSPGKKMFARKLFYSDEDISTYRNICEKDSRDKMLAQWKERYLEYQNPYKKEDLSIETADGHMVRSKSERMICDELAKEGFNYKYEIAFWSRVERIFPDFFIFDYRTGRYYIWEHFGLMDSSRYVNRECLSKIDAYAAEGFELGRNLLVTFESSERPLQLSHVRRIINMIKNEK